MTQPLNEHEYDITNWSNFIDTVLDTAHASSEKAMSLLLKALPDIENEYALTSSECAFAYHQLAILYMLNSDYDNAEKYFLATMEVYETIGGAPEKEYASAAKHLTLVYEAKARKKIN